MQQQPNPFATPRVGQNIQQQHDDSMPFASPKQQMDAIVSQVFEPTNDEIDSALAVLESGTPHILLTQDEKGNFRYYDAILKCSRHSLFTLIVRNELDYTTNKPIKQRESIQYQWFLQQLLGFSLEDQASELITQYAQTTTDNINPLALAFQFNIEGDDAPDIFGLHNGELSLLARNESITNNWVVGLGIVADHCELHLCGEDDEQQMNDTFNGVENAMNGVNLNTPQKNTEMNGLPMLPQPTTDNSSRMSVQIGSARRMTRFSIAPTNITGNGRQSIAPGTNHTTRQFGKSIFPNANTNHTNSTNTESNRAVSCELIRSIETQYEQKIAQLEETHVKEKSSLRQQQKAEIRDFQQKNEKELKTVEENYRIELQNITDNHVMEMNTAKQENVTALQKKLQSLKDSQSEEISQIIAKSHQELLLAVKNAENGFNLQLQNVHQQYENDMAELIDKHLNESEQLQNIVTNLFHDKKKLINALIESQGNIRVFVRVRPILPHEIQQSKESGIVHHNTCIDVINQLDMFNSANTSTTALSAQEKLKNVKNAKSDISTLLADQLGAYKVTVTDSDKHTPTANGYLFEHVFDQDSSQSDVVQEVLPFVTSVADGYNVCILAYGQTGSGKTFTMEGTDVHMGVNYTALHALFNTLSERQEQLEKTGVELKFCVEISAVEIYNEAVKDLFTNDQVNISYVSNKATFQGMTAREVHNCDEIRNELRTKAYPNRTVAATNMNAVSSRSHSLIFVNIKSTYTVFDSPGQQEIVQSRLVLVDLAGSERVSRSGVQGQAFTEATNINKSLSTLGLCLAQLQQGEKHIQFRDSKLTMALADCLTGDSKVLMFANVSPANINASETNSTLQFALRAQKTGLGKATKNTTATGALSMPMTGIPGRTTVSAPKGRSNEEEKLKAIEKELALVKTELQTTKSELSQVKIQHKSTENIINGQKDTIKGLESQLIKSHQNRQSIAVMKYPNKRSTITGVRSKVAAAMNAGNINNNNNKDIDAIEENVNENDTETSQLTTDEINSEFVQLDPILFSPIPSPTISSSSSEKQSTTTSTITGLKRRSQDPTDSNQIKQERLATHVNKQPRTTTSVSAMSASISTSSASSRPTMTSKISPPSTSTGRTTMSGARPLAQTTNSSNNRPNMSNTTVSRAPLSSATVSANVVKKPLATASTISRPTMSSFAASTSTPIRKPVTSSVASAMKKPLGK